MNLHAAAARRLQRDGHTMAAGTRSHTWDAAGHVASTCAGEHETPCLALALSLTGSVGCGCNWPQSWRTETRT